MRARRYVGVAAAVVLLAPVPGVGAQEEPDVSTTHIGANVLEVEATVLEVEATIIDLDAGTRTTRSNEEVTVALAADVFFAFDEYELLPESLDVLDDVVADIEEAGITAVAIGGHTDAVGTDDYNQVLSERRAESVEAYLSDRLSGVALTSEGFGASQPVEPNSIDGQDNPAGRAQNRRVEITYAGSQG